MKRLLFLASIAMFVVSFASAQSLAPSANELGIGAAVSSSNNTFQVFYHVSKSLVLAPLVGFYSRNYADTAGGVTTNYPGTWWEAGLGVYYVVPLFPRLNVQIGPAFQYASEKYKANGNPDNQQFTYWNAAVNLQVVAAVTKNLSVFTSFGGYYYSQNTQDTTTSTSTLQTGYGLDTPALGVIYYFK